MGKLANLMAAKRDLASEYERELRAVRNLILGPARLSGSNGTVDLAATEGSLPASPARAAFVEALREAIQEPLLKYAQDLAREGLAHGIDPARIGNALAGMPSEAAPADAAEPPRAASTGPTLRLAVSN